MEKFKELSIEEIQGVDGGYWPTSFSGNKYVKCYLTVQNFCSDVGDFVSGVADGFVQGFKETI